MPPEISSTELLHSFFLHSFLLHFFGQLSTLPTFFFLPTFFLSSFLPSFLPSIRYIRYIPYIARCRTSFFDRLSTVNCQLSTVNCQLSTNPSDLFYSTN
ncbi:hypothetical protein [Microcoleus sp. CAWBG58]|uniref:hypothetical protein n=1 Tax=Microcoleus sp. CAWBG58 TaxID=2841651 RepID=UPI0025FD9593|nr:hypothetical protein [Microcoleus sp. CAWBG58]